MSSETVRTTDPKTLHMPHPNTLNTAQRLADLPAISSSLLDLFNHILKKLTTLPSDLSFNGLEEYRALVCRELAAAGSSTPGVFEQAAKEEHDFKNAQKVQLEMLVDEVKDLIQRAMEALQMVADAKLGYPPNIGNERITENQQQAHLSTIVCHQRPPKREQPWHQLGEHKAEPRKEWDQLDLGSRLDLLELDDKLAEADLQILSHQIKDMEREREERLKMIRDLKKQWMRKMEVSEKDTGSEAMVNNKQTLPVRLKSEDEKKVEDGDSDGPWIA